MTEAEARALTDEIKEPLKDVTPLFLTAFVRRADRALGYRTWPEYCLNEFRDFRPQITGNRETRQQAVATMKAGGMSGHAIALALGIAETTVRRDLDNTESDVRQNGERDPVQGLDGKKYPKHDQGRQLP